MIKIGTLVYSNILNIYGFVIFIDPYYYKILWCVSDNNKQVCTWSTKKFIKFITDTFDEEIKCFIED